MSNEVVVEIAFVPPNVLRVDPDEVPVAGSVRIDGNDRPFYGWMDLLSCLESIARSLVPDAVADKAETEGSRG